MGVTHRHVNAPPGPLQELHPYINTAKFVLLSDDRLPGSFGLCTTIEGTMTVLRCVY